MKVTVRSNSNGATIPVEVDQQPIKPPPSQPQRFFDKPPPFISKLTLDAHTTIPPPPIVSQRGRRHFAPRLNHDWLKAAGGRRSVQRAMTPRRLRMLDGFMLLDACGVEFPDEASRADVQEEGLTDAIAEDLAYFTNLIYLNAGDNELPFEKLVGLPSLQELHLHCNCLRSIPRIDKLPSIGSNLAFAALEVLDLSFNKLTKDAISHLSVLPRLRVLDLTCNSLNAMPSMMVEFSVLEVLCLERNRLEREETLLALSTIPRLRELNLSHNYFRRVSSAVAHSATPSGVGGFGTLEWLNLAHNYIATESDVVSLVALPKLTDVILYGNPMTIKGKSKGKSKHGSRRKKKEGDAHVLPVLSRASTSNRILNFVTEAPDTRKRATGVGSYTDVQIRTVEGTSIPTNAQWREAGNRALRKLEKEKSVEMKAASSFVSKENSEESSKVPEATERAPTSGPASSSRGSLRNAADGFFLTEADDGGDDNGRRYEDEEDYNDYNDDDNFGEPLLMPKNMLGAPLVPRRNANAGGVRSDPATLRKAMTSLRHMLKHPVAVDDFAGGEKTYMKRTNANKGMQRPRIPYVPLRERRGRQQQQQQLSGGGSMQSPVGQGGANPVLANIEYVLDQMNDRVAQVENDMGMVQYTDNTMSNLISMVNDVMSTFEEGSA
jgi:hypothetical protein